MDFIYKINSIYKSYKYFFDINFDDEEIDDNSNSINAENIDTNSSNSIDSIDTDKKEYINNYNSYLLMPLGFSLFFNKPINIIDNIYIGNVYCASNWSIISNLGINFIINFNKKIENFYPEEKNIKFITIDLESNLENIEEILDMLNQIQTKIDSKSKKENNILLFSLAGNNTPCIIMIAYLVFKYNFQFKKALLHICTKIPNYNLNKKYIRVLKLKYN